MKRIAIPVLLLCLAVAACKRETVIGDKYASFSYALTACADPWPGSTDSATLVKNIGNYLSNEKNIYIASIHISFDGTQEICHACPCKTGGILHVTSFDDEVMRERLSALGFE